MAVASESSEKIASLPMEPSVSKSASDLASEDTPDGIYQSNSSPNLNGETEVESQALLRIEEYRQLFRLPPEEALVQDFNCALQESILLQGHMYLFTRYICFYSNIFGFETKKIIPFIEITSVLRAKIAGIFPNAIEIFAGGRKYFFASFLSRDGAFKLINDGWLQHCSDAKAIREQQELIFGLNTQDNGLVTENVNSFKEFGESGCKTRNQDASPLKEPTFSPSPPVQNDRVLLTLPGLEDNEPVGFIESSSSTKTWTWNEEDNDAPEIQESYSRVAETKFPIKVEELFNLFFSDGAGTFIESFHRRCGDKEFRCSLWYQQDKLCQTRDASFQHPIKIYFGAKYGRCQEVQKLRVYRNSHMVIETSQEISNVPYGDYFRVQVLWDVVKDGDGESNEGCILQIYVDVAFSKKTLFKGKIVQSTMEECREAYATWINMAHELLKQRNLEKQEEVPATSLIQNGKVHSESEFETAEASEMSSELNHHGRTAQTSRSFEFNEPVGDIMQGNFLNATWVTSFLGEYLTRFCAFLRGQSQISLILVVAFAVIFLMQVNIVVLLNRPQNVHVVPHADYYRSDRMSERSDEAVAWLERRVHHLKEDIFMVETRLDRLQNQHKWLKKQVKDLDGPRKSK